MYRGIVWVQPKIYELMATGEVGNCVQADKMIPIVINETSLENIRKVMQEIVDKCKTHQNTD